MKIRKRLNLNTVISIAAVVLIILSLAWSYQEETKANRNMDLVEEIRNVSFERIMLRDDFLLHGEERAKIQFHAKSETLRRLLDMADQRFTGRTDRDLLRKARKDFDATHVSISSFMEHHKRKDPGSTRDFNFTETESMLVSQAFLKAYSLAARINRLHISADNELARVRERSIVIVVFFAFAGIIVIIANSTILNRLLNRRILELGEGIEIIGAGDLEYRIDARGDDELSALALGANAMAGNLKLSYTSVKNLQQEIIERKQAEETLRQSERKLSLHLQQTMFAVIEWDAEYRVREWNPAATAIFGYSREEAMGRHVSELILPRSITEDIGKVMSHLLAQNGGTHNTNENATKDGRVIVCEWVNTPLVDERGTATGGISFALDITERKRAEEELRRSEDRFATVFRASPICTSLSRLSDGTFLDINDAFLRLFGYDRDQVIGRNPLMLNIWVNPDDRARMVETLRERGRANGFETVFRTKSGEIRNVIVISEVVEEAGDQYILGLTLDITDHKNADAEKEKLQGQLLQAMKMEAVGRLAGGVAHDFNNLLTVITGYCEILMQKVGEESPMYHEMTEIQRAGERAASLTQQLLAFSRKQIIEPKVVQLDHLVAEMHKMLTRLIGEDIALQATTGKSLGSVKVDPGQFQQILMNLVVNARDAMPGGGKIVFEIANVDLDAGYCALHTYVKPGRFVMLAVSDTGIGMSEEVKAHIFEPFFTTKEKGKGTGLGLAMTYGVVKRAGGSIEVYSEVGIGTTFKIYLPRVEEEAVKPLKSVLSRDLPGGTETVLLVEDEDSVRDLCVQILVRLGYKVLRGSNGTEAIAAAQGYGDRIDLLLTDVVMPGMSGAELATQLVLHHPEMKVLFTSGYTDDAITRHGILDEGVSFIGKPYTSLGLARKVREVLDET